MPHPLSQALRVVSEDVIFATLAAEKADADLWAELAARRAEAYKAALGGTAGHASDREGFTITLSRALAPSLAPRFLPMHELADAFGLAGGARGLKSLFSSKPSDKDRARVRNLALTASLVSASAMAANGELSAEERLFLRASAACFGLLPEEEMGVAAVGAEAPDKVSLPTEIDGKAARAMVKGAWLAAVQDGLDIPDEGVVAILANRLGVSMQESGALGAEVKTAGMARQAMARAAVEAMTVVSKDALPSVTPFAELITYLAVPAPFRGAVLAPIATGTAGAITAKSTDKHARTASLAIAWAAALADDPTITRRSVLAARHDQAAKALGAEDDGERTRHLVERHAEREIAKLGGG